MKEVPVHIDNNELFGRVVSNLETARTKLTRERLRIEEAAVQYGTPSEEVGHGR